MSDLAPCPFCGASGEELMVFCDPDEAKDNSGPSRRIQCAVCHIEAPFYPSEAEAIAAWNRRADRTPLAAPVAEGWRDMASAPKDGALFVATKKWPNGDVHVATYKWMGAPNYWNEMNGSKCACTCIRPEYQDHFQWMPLPPAPGTAPSGTAEVEVVACPDCGRRKAKNAGDAARGDCPKWWAIRDEMAEQDCKNHTVRSLGTTASPASDVGVAPKRWLMEHTLPSGSIRWRVFEHENQARIAASKVFERCCVITPLYAHPPTVEVREPDAELVRPIVGIENRTAQEVFDIMADRIRYLLSKHGGNDA